MDIDTLTQALWPQGNTPASPQVYAVLDGARHEAIARLVRLSDLPFTCLYSGPLSPALQAAAPYLVQLAPQSRFFKTLVESGWGQAWGLFAVAPADVTLQALRKHLRTLLRVQDEQGRVLAFRFYDPRVLRVYLPTCEPFETKQFFGPIKTVVCEAEQGASLLRYAC
jgi:hypothetical protein